VLKIKIDHVDTGPLKTFIASFYYIIRPTVGAATKIFKLGGEENVGAPFLKYDGKYFLVLTASISIGGIDEILSASRATWTVAMASFSSAGP